MIAGGNAPQLVGPNGVATVAQFFDSWADITPFIDAEKLDISDFYGPAVALNQYPTINTGLPLGLYPSFILYNTDMFDAAGLDYPPSDFDDKSWNMDKVREIGMKLTLDANGHPASGTIVTDGSTMIKAVDGTVIYSHTVTKSIVENIACGPRRHAPVSGTVETTYNGDSVSIDFGDGSCTNNTVTCTLNGVTTTKTLGV